MRRRRSVTRICAALAALLHVLAVAWTWLAWSPGVRSTWLVWLDFPISLLYLHKAEPRLLAWSLLLGSLQWAATGALLAWAVGAMSARRVRKAA